MTVLVQDLFTGTNGTDISAHAPDIDVVGSGWLDSGANEVELDGSGALKFSNLSKNCVIDIGTTEQIVTANFNAGGADNRVSLGLRADGLLSTGSETYYNFNFRIDDTTNTLKIFRFVSGTGIVIASSGNLGLSNSTTYELTCSAVGSTLEFYVDGALELSVTDTSITTGDYAGLEHQKYVNGNARFNDFLVEDTGGTTLTITESGPSFTDSITSVVTGSITTSIVGTGPSFTDSITVAVTSAGSISGSIAGTGPSFTDAVTISVTGNITVSITNAGPSFTDSVNSIVAGSITTSIIETGPGFTDAVTVSVTLPGTIDASIIGNGPSFIEYILTSIPVAWTDKAPVTTTWTDSTKSSTIWQDK
jgi:hypothetical protein